MIYFYELHTNEEPKGNFKIQDFEGQGVFQYFPETDSFVEIEGYMDERAEIVSGEDGWNCIDFIINIIHNTEEFNSVENLDKLDFVSLTNEDAESRVYAGKDVSYHDDNDELITINTTEQFEAKKLLFSDERFFYFPKSLEIFRINGEIPESLESLEDCKLFLDYLYDDCDLVGVFHPDDSFSNYTDSEGDEIFTIVQQEKYTKYIEDMFELDADGDSEFVKAGYGDVYDYCMNYRNDNNGINEIYPMKLKYGSSYIRRDSKVSGQLTQNVDENGKQVQIFHDSDNGLDYYPNGRLVSGAYNRKNPEDLISENKIK